MEHYPVLLSECIAGLKVKAGGLYLDGTLGRGGHSEELLKQGVRLVAIDRDLAAIEQAGRRLAAYTDRLTLVHGNFGDVNSILSAQGIKKVDGMLFDLGVSSPQLDEAERGFSYMADSALDMRMDRSSRYSTADLVNQAGERELKRILYEYGEERYAPQIAAAIVRRRAEKEITNTLELVEIIRGAMPAKALREKQHPAKRSFQALRIAVNDEMGEIEKMLAQFVGLLNPGGRICVITFHSLEDRLVKRSFLEYAKGCECPPDFPVCVCDKEPQIRIITKKPLTASAEELEHNPRSRSAKLRIAEKL